MPDETFLVNMPVGSIYIYIHMITHPCFSNLWKLFGLNLGGGFKYVLFSPGSLGKIPRLTSIFFNWVAQPPTSNFCFNISEPIGLRLEPSLLSEFISLRSPCGIFEHEQAESTWRIIPCLVSGFHNHGDRFRPLRIGLWDPFQMAFPWGSETTY